MMIAVLKKRKTLVYRILYSYLKGCRENRSILDKVASSLQRKLLVWKSWKRSGTQFYFPETMAHEQKMGGRDILFLSHELSMTGAPLVLLDAVAVSMEQGDFPVVLSLADGPLKESFLRMGVVVVVNPVLDKGFSWFAEKFDLVVANTLAVAGGVEQLSDASVPVAWWIHEGTVAIEVFQSVMPRKLGSNITVFSCGEYTQRLLSDFSEDYHSELLRFAVRDIAVRALEEPSRSRKLKMLVIGSLESRKGQDVLLQAVDQLPEDYRQRVLFCFAGKPLEETISSMVMDYAEKYDCVEYLGLISREQVLSLYRDALCTVIPSRDDPGPLTAVESAMLSRAVILSENTGFAANILEKENGMVFASGDVAMLVEQIMYAIDHPDQMLEMGKRLRKVYEQIYQFPIFRQRYCQIADRLTGAVCRE